MSYVKSAAVKLLALAALCALLPFVILERLKPNRRDIPRVFFGATSIHVLPKLAAALRRAGYPAISAAVADVDFHVPPGFDRIVKRSASHNAFVRNVAGGLEAISAFLWALRRADIFQFYFDGGLLRRTPLQLHEIRLLQLAGKKVIVFPYGSDTWSIERTPDPALRAALLADYPQLSGRSTAVAQRIDRFCAEADIVVGCLVHNMVLPRCDALMLTCYGVETDTLRASPLDIDAKTLRVFHAPNHRNFKGTPALIDAVEGLRASGFAIELDLVERVPREDVLRRMAKAHVVVDQLLCGYAMTALEGMALGRIVISGENWPPSLAPFQHMASFRDCPIQWASPTTISEVLRSLCQQRHMWQTWGDNGRAFVERYHSPEAMAKQWSALYPLLGYDVSPNALR